MTPVPLSEFITAIQYLTALASFGLLLAQQLLWQPVLRNGFPDSAQGTSALTSPTAVRALNIVSTLCTLLLVPVFALRVLGEPLAALFSPTEWQLGVTWQPLVAATMAIAGTLCTLTSGRGQLGGALTLLAPVMIGHSISESPRWLMLSADITHLFVGAFWFGSLIALVALLARARVTSDQRRITLAVIGRFSLLAGWSVVLLAASGLTLAAVVLDGGFTALFSTAYGHLLLLKVGLVCGVLPIAAWNRWHLLPSLRSCPNDAEQWNRLRRTMAWEAVVLIAVLGVTGMLTNQSPHEMGAQSAIAVRWMR